MTTMTVCGDTVTPPAAARTGSQPRVAAPKPDQASPRTITRAAVADALPIALSVAPFGMLIGVAIAALPGSPAAGLSGAPLLYAGSAHLAAVSLLGRHGSVLAVVATIAVINARFLVYSAGLSPYFARQPSWFRWVAPHFIIDQTYGLVLRRGDLDDPRCFRRYWCAITGVILPIWILSMTAGALLGPVIPDT